MEVTARTGTRKTGHGVLGGIRSKSSFDCDPAEMDSILGIRSLGDLRLRFDAGSVREESNSDKPQHYAPIEVVLAKPASSPGLESESINSEARRERMIRLLDQQQAWYDAAHEAARAAEELLLLCEHHQQQWLQSPIPHP
jgi:hypothetical protein